MSESSHWYDLDGTPHHQVPNKSKPGQMRNATIRDAKDLSLMPSVSAMTGMLDKPALRTWLAQQNIKSALAALPIQPGESEYDFITRALKDGGSPDGTAAADFGTGVHAELENYMKGKPYDPEASMYYPFRKGFDEWAVRHGLQPIFYNGHAMVEQSFCNVEGAYAGTYDFKGFIAAAPGCSCGCGTWGFGQGQSSIYVLIDYKTQRTSKNRPVNFYPEWGPQLAAYVHGTEYIGPWLHGKQLDVAHIGTPVGAPKPLKMSVVVSSTEPGRIESQAWEDSHNDWAWQSFKSLRQLYYSPLGPGAGLPWRPTDE